jgi:hypothetical protein
VPLNFGGVGSFATAFPIAPSIFGETIDFGEAVEAIVCLSESGDRISKEENFEVKGFQRLSKGFDEDKKRLGSRAQDDIAVTTRSK